MAEIVDTVVQDGRTIIVYDNGMRRDKSTGHIVRGPDSTLINETNASEYHRRQRELRAQVIRQAANDAVERQSYRDMYGDMAFVAAVAEAQYIKATTPEDPKSTAAANFLMKQANLHADDDDNAQLAPVERDVDARLARILAQVLSDVSRREIVDVEAVDV